MRGRTPKQTSLVALASLEDVVPQDHPLRAIKKLADAALAQLSKVFDEMYAAGGRPSIPPERLLKAGFEFWHPTWPAAVSDLVAEAAST